MDYRWKNLFNEIKLIVTRDALLVYLDFNKRIYIYTDASKFQLGAVIIQYAKPIALYSHKLTQPQQQYTVTENELLSIVETLKEFCIILLGQRINIYTDHKF